MAGHPALSYVKEKREIVSISGSIYKVHLTYHKVSGISGYVAGIKFSDSSDSMDSSKTAKVNPFLLGSAIAQRTIQMIKPDLKQISILGFYLLTDDLETRRQGASKLKKRLYNAQAIEIHSKVKYRLPHLTRVETDGGIGWAMSEHDFESLDEYKIFEQELAKELRVISC